MIGLKLNQVTKCRQVTSGEDNPWSKVIQELFELPAIDQSGERWLKYLLSPKPGQYSKYVPC